MRYVMDARAHDVGSETTVLVIGIERSMKRVMRAR